jgi:hypothetical protein
VTRGSVWLAAGALVLLAGGTGPGGAAPVEVYRTGPQFCPHDRRPDAPTLDEAAAVVRARGLLPQDFCGPTRFVAGCDVLVDRASDHWQVYFHQYRKHGGRNDWHGLTHTYVILDRVGNCLANIPGTELGAYN